jgi:hypothetical protein
MVYSIPQKRAPVQSDLSVQTLQIGSQTTRMTIADCRSMERGQLATVSDSCHV